MSVNWSKDIDQTLAAANEQSRPILLNFSAAPACGACAVEGTGLQSREIAEKLARARLPL